MDATNERLGEEFSFRRLYVDVKSDQVTEIFDGEKEQSIHYTESLKPYGITSSYFFSSSLNISHQTNFNVPNSPFENIIK